MHGQGRFLYIFCCCFGDLFQYSSRQANKERLLKTETHRQGRHAISTFVSVKTNLDPERRKETFFQPLFQLQISRKKEAAKTDSSPLKGLGTVMLHSDISASQTTLCTDDCSDSLCTFSLS